MRIPIQYVYSIQPEGITSTILIHMPRLPLGVVHITSGISRLRWGIVPAFAKRLRHYQPSSAPNIPLLTCIPIFGAYKTLAIPTLLNSSPHSFYEAYCLCSPLPFSHSTHTKCEVKSTARPHMCPTITLCSLLLVSLIATLVLIDVLDAHKHNRRKIRPRNKKFTALEAQMDDIE